MGNRAAAAGVLYLATIVFVALGASACGDKPTQPGTSLATDTIATITLSPVDPTVPVGTLFDVTALIANATGEPITGRTITWTSTRPEVARVNDAGSVTALEIGETTITATCERKSGSTLVKVVQPVAVSVLVSPPAATVGLGRTVQLIAVPTDVNNNVLTGKIVIWTSSAPTIMSVNDVGLVTGLVLGTATITAQVDGAAGFATVVVTQNPN